MEIEQACEIWQVKEVHSLSLGCHEGNKVKCPAKHREKFMNSSTQEAIFPNYDPTTQNVNVVHRSSKPSYYPKNIIGRPLLSTKSW